MAYIRFIGNKVAHKATVIPNGNIVTIEFEKEIVENTNGFDLFLDDECTIDIGGTDYHGFTTIYRNDDETIKYNGYQLSNDGSVYNPDEPSPEPEPEPPVEPTLEELKEYKVSEVKYNAERDIEFGISLDGHEYGYTMPERIAFRNVFEDTSTSKRNVFVSDKNGNVVELTSEKAVELYEKQEKHRIEKESHVEQLEKMIRDSESKEAVSNINYESSLEGYYLQAYNERVEKEKGTLESVINSAAAVRTQAMINAVSNTDEQALQVKGLYVNWGDRPDGYKFSMENPEDLRCNDRGRLWALQKDHAKQDNWRPGNDPTLWREIVEGHKGTYEDPIPVPDSVKTSGFEYEYGKYYLEDDVKYLAKRDGMKDGQKETLYFFPSELVNINFIIA